MVIIAALFVATARSAEEKSDMAILQGTWKGQEIGGNTSGTTFLIITGKKFEFRGADTNEWYKGTYTLKEDLKPHQLLGTIADCPSPEYNGKTSIVIYKIEDGTLTFTAREPGNTNAPESFDATETRRFSFKKD